MPSATLDEVLTPAPVPSQPSRQLTTAATAFDQDAESEAYDFIARCVLEKDAQFFDG